MVRTQQSRNRLAPVAGLLVGAVAGVATTSTGAALALRDDGGAARSSLEVTHVSPLLTAEDDPAELRYDVYCVDDDVPESRCDAEGVVFVRAGGDGRFQRIDLAQDPSASEGRYVAALPSRISRSPGGFSYYAVITSARLGRTVTLPGGGAAAPHRSLPLRRAVTVDLEVHEFGRFRSPDARVAEARWGTDAGEVGLEEGRNLAPIGGSSFDVAVDGSVHVLDEANRRLLRFAPGVPRPTHVPLDVAGTIADLVVAEDGTIYVLETAPRNGAMPALKTFAPDGSPRGAVELAEHAAQVRPGPGGSPFVLQHPSGQWMAAEARGRLLDARDQRASARSGRPLPGGGEVTVLRHRNELRLAVVSANGVRRSWRVTSATPLAEVQLADVVGNRLVVVARAYTDADDRFVVLVLDDRGAQTTFSLDSADWAETAPLSRFRLVGSSLYRLGSTAEGIFVDRIDLEAER